MKRMNKSRKGEFDIKSYMITFLLITGVLVTLGSTSYNIVDNYEAISDAKKSTEFQETYNQMEEIASEVDDVETAMGETGTGTEDSQTQFYGGALSSVKITWRSFGFVKTMIKDMARYINAPDIWFAIAITGISFSLIAVVLFMIFKSTGK